MTLRGRSVSCGSVSLYWPSSVTAVRGIAAAFCSGIGYGSSMTVGLRAGS